MKHHIKLFAALIKNNLVREMEYRANFLIHTFLDMAWVFVQILILQIYFQYTNTVFGWSKLEIFAMTGAFRVVKGLYDGFLRSNVHAIPDRVTKGQLDYLFSWPVNSQFMISVGRHIYSDLGSTIAGLAVLIYSLNGLDLLLNFFVWINIIVSLTMGLGVFYSIMFFVSTFSLFMTKMTSIRAVYDVFSNTVRFPIEALTGGNRVIEFLFLPLAVVVTMPANIFLGKVTWYFIGLEIFVSVLIFFLVNRFWKYAVLRYSSASS